MAYEVTKRVGERAYRYRVESYRDAASSKVRARWTYLGVVAPDGIASPPAKRLRADRTRERLIAAFIALAREHTYRDVTAGAVAIKAGVAHGTFYRHFSDKRGLLLAALEHVRRELDRTRPDFGAPIGSRAEERVRVRRWLAAMFEWPGSNAGLFRAFVDALDGDDEMRAVKRARAAERVASLADYFERLHEARVASIEHPEALAAALTVLVDGALRELLVLPHNSATAPLALGIGEAFDRAIFAER